MILSEDPTIREFGGKYAEAIASTLQKMFAPHKVQLVGDVILKTVDNGLRHFEDRLQRTLIAFNFDSLESEQLLNLEQLLLYVENYVMQMFRDLLTKDPPIISSNTLVCYDTTVLPTKPTKSKRDLFRETFQTTHAELMENIEPDGLLLDHLASKKIITSSDEESIASSSGRRGRTRKLLSIVSSTTTNQIEDVFIPALKATHPKIAETFMKTYKALEERPNTPSASEICLPCRIKNEVDLSRVAHTLYTTKSINTRVYADLCNPSALNQMKWDIISGKKETHVAVIEALRTKYKELHRQCQYLHIRDLTCTCPKLELRIESAPIQAPRDTWQQQGPDYLVDSPSMSMPTLVPQNPSTSLVAGLSNVSSNIPDHQASPTYMYSHNKSGLDFTPFLNQDPKYGWMNRSTWPAPLDLSTNPAVYEGFGSDLTNINNMYYPSFNQNISTPSYTGLPEAPVTPASNNMTVPSSSSSAYKEWSDVETFLNPDSNAGRTKDTLALVDPIPRQLFDESRRGVKRTMSSTASVAALSDFSEFGQGSFGSICSDDHAGSKRFRSVCEDPDTRNAPLRRRPSKDNLWTYLSNGNVQQVSSSTTTKSRWAA